MTHQYAVEIALTRPASARELHRARCCVAFAANTNRTRLMTVQSAKSPGRALHRLRRRLDSLLPIDVLSTHYPDRHGRVLLNVVLSRRAHAQIRQEAAASGAHAGEVLRERITARLAREQRERHQRLESQLRRLVTHRTPEEVLACAAGHLLQARPPV
ncbi:hypothetical protein [Streptomyces doebereineriae]|uniref:Uncharacterized protein n=1 Tax=Streptomyces doebereineriae TaxID=3075528 RepID=A0ABU2V302_9ACTN|nr:hypothetical protein [Streptomyces sp. DSM 41640]MDT0479758.1 hypothetical protein [Streptomyces sp. DSM 41640]